MSSPISFGPFHLDPEKRCLLRGAAPVELRRKAWEVLRHLCERPDTVVSNDELLDAVWPGVAVTPQTVANVIRELRLALVDSAGAPRWIATVRGRGYVFRPTPALDDATEATVPAVIARTHEREELAARWARAMRGEPQVVLVTGEPGIGKTTLADDFANGAARTAQSALWLGRGAAMEQHGQPESYLPILAALTHMATGPRARALTATFRRAAPTWLLHLPHLLRPEERRRIVPALVGATSARMLREGIDVLRGLAESAPLLLVLEDLHWADAATLDFIGALARSPSPLRLCIVATFRPVDAAIREHRITALARELVRERHAVELPLAPFDEPSIAAYLGARLGPGAPPARLAARLEALSAGNPLFLRALVDDLLEAGAFVSGPTGWQLADDADRLLAELPESLRAFVASEAARLPHPLRRIVEAASVIGTAALVPELATMLGQPPAKIADACERLASIGRLLRRAGEGAWPDGSVVGRYAFPHAAHRHIIYDGLPTHDRRALHRKLAVALEAAYGPGAATVAARLAAHFDQAGLGARAVEWLEHAATGAEARCAYGEAAAHMATALARLDALATTPGGDTTPRAGLLCLRLGEILVLAHGYSRPEVEHAYARALSIFEEAAHSLGIFTAEMGLAVVDLTRARHRAAHGRTQRMSALAAGDPALAAIAACWAGFASSGLGELGRARRELEAGLGSDVTSHVPRNFSIPRMLRSQLALVHTVQGDDATAERYAADARARSQRHGAVSELAHAELLAAERAVFTRDPHGAATTAAAIELAEANGLASYRALLDVYDAALRPEWPADRRRTVMRAALADRDRLGDRWHGAFLLALVAEVEIADGDHQAARAAVAEAFAHITATDERYYEAEVWRLRGECALAAGDAADARTSLCRAAEVARAQGALRWERQATARLVALSGGGRTASRRRP